MFCKNCGKEIPDNATFCTYCGAQSAAPQQQVQQPQQPVYQQPTYQQPVYQQPTYQQPVYQQPGYAPVPYESPEGKSAATAALVWGILSFVLCAVPILGFVFGIIAIKKANTAKRLGVKNGMVTTGLVLGIIGLIAGIIWTIYWIVAIIILIAAGSYTGYYDYYY